MSKIICDVCGTSFPASAEQCPICGCVRPVNPAQNNTEQDTPVFQKRENYTYVKGGRFSKANVQKRNQGVVSEPVVRKKDANKSQNPKSDRGLVIAVIVLLLAIIAVVIYIAIHFFTGADEGLQDQNRPIETTASRVQEESTSGELPTQLEIVCNEIMLSDTEITLDSEGAVFQLDVKVSPSDTTEVLLYASEDEGIATVSENGEIVAVAAGETVINVTCGEATAQCRVVCKFTDETVDSTTAPTISDETYRAPYKINKVDVTIRVGETFELKLSDADGKIIPVTWTMSELETCTVEGNAVTGAKSGRTELSVVYEGETYSCIVRVL